MKITCDEATTICDKSQYKEASLFEMIKLNLHFIFCKHCRKYTKQNAHMTKLCAQVSAKKAEQTSTLSEDEKQKLKEQLMSFKIED